MKGLREADVYNRLISEIESGDYKRDNNCDKLDRINRRVAERDIDMEAPSPSPQITNFKRERDCFKTDDNEAPPAPRRIEWNSEREMGKRHEDHDQRRRSRSPLRNVHKEERNCESNQSSRSPPGVRGRNVNNSPTRHSKYTRKREDQISEIRCQPRSSRFPVRDEWCTKNPRSSLSRSPSGHFNCMPTLEGSRGESRMSHSPSRRVNYMTEREFNRSESREQLSRSPQNFRYYQSSGSRSRSPPRDIYPLQRSFERNDNNSPSRHYQSSGSRSPPRDINSLQEERDFRRNDNNSPSRHYQSSGLRSPPRDINSLQEEKGFRRNDNNSPSRHYQSSGSRSPPRDINSLQEEIGFRRNEYNSPLRPFMEESHDNKRIISRSPFRSESREDCHMFRSYQSRSLSPSANLNSMQYDEGMGRNVNNSPSRYYNNMDDREGHGQRMLSYSPFRDEYSESRSPPTDFSFVHVEKKFPRNVDNSSSRHFSCMENIEDYNEHMLSRSSFRSEHKEEAKTYQSSRSRSPPMGSGRSINNFGLSSSSSSKYLSYKNNEGSKNATHVIKTSSDIMGFEPSTGSTSPSYGLNINSGNFNIASATHFHRSQMNFNSYPGFRNQYPKQLEMNTINASSLVGETITSNCRKPEKNISTMRNQTLIQNKDILDRSNMSKFQKPQMKLARSSDIGNQYSKELNYDSLKASTSLDEKAASNYRKLHTNTTTVRNQTSIQSKDNLDTLNLSNFQKSQMKLDEKAASNYRKLDTNTTTVRNQKSIQNKDILDRSNLSKFQKPQMKLDRSADIGNQYSKQLNCDSLKASTSLNEKAASDYRKLHTNTTTVRNQTSIQSKDNLDTLNLSNFQKSQMKLDRTSDIGNQYSKQLHCDSLKASTSVDEKAVSNYRKLDTNTTTVRNQTSIQSKGHIDAANSTKFQSILNTKLSIGNQYGKQIQLNSSNALVGEKAASNYRIPETNASQLRNQNNDKYTKKPLIKHVNEVTSNTSQYTSKNTVATPLLERKTQAPNNQLSQKKAPQVFLISKIISKRKLNSTEQKNLKDFVSLQDPIKVKKIITKEHKKNRIDVYKKKLADFTIIRCGFNKPSAGHLKAKPKEYWTQWWSLYKYIENAVTKVDPEDDVVHQINNFMLTPQDLEYNAQKQKLLTTGINKINRNLNLTEYKYPYVDAFKLFKFKKHLEDPKFQRTIQPFELTRVQKALDRLKCKPKLAFLHQSLICRWHSAMNIVKRANDGQMIKFTYSRCLLRSKIFNYLVFESIQILKKLCQEDWPEFEEFYKALKVEEFDSSGIALLHQYGKQSHSSASEEEDSDDEHEH